MHISPLLSVKLVSLVVSCLLVDISKALDENEPNQLKEPDAQAYSNVDRRLGPISDDSGADDQLFIQYAAVFMQTVLESIATVSIPAETSRRGEIRGIELRLMKELCTSYSDAELCRQAPVSSGCDTIGKQLLNIERRSGLGFKHLHRYLDAIKSISGGSGSSRTPATKKEDNCNLITKLINWLGLD